MNRPQMVTFAAAVLATCGVLAATAEPALRSSPAKATRADLAAGMPSFARGYRLSLTRAVIPPGAAFPPHRHPGMQVSYIESGTLQFKVFRGAVTAYRGTADGTQTRARTIRAGHTGSIARGEWIVENQFLWHQGANVGRSTVVILLATLLRADKPPAIPVTPRSSVEATVDAPLRSGRSSTHLRAPRLTMPPRQAHRPGTKRSRQPPCPEMCECRPRHNLTLARATPEPRDVIVTAG